MLKGRHGVFEPIRLVVSPRNDGKADDVGKIHGDGLVIFCWSFASIDQIFGDTGWKNFMQEFFGQTFRFLQLVGLAFE